MSNKPRLSLKMGNKGADGRSPSISNPLTASGTPTATSSTKLMLRLGSLGSKASTPIESSAPPVQLSESPQTPKKNQRARKPSAKVLAAANVNGKREHSDSEDDILSTRPVKKASKLKIRINQTTNTHTPSTPVGVVKLKVKGKPPKRPRGEGYDSEASDRELDPSIEEQFVIRFDDRLISSSGADCSDDCAYVRQMIQERKIGAGAEIWLQFHHPDGRRAVVTVRKHHYAAALVDMPTITESMKSFDRKTWMKTADVSQMLLVFARINRVDEIKKIELPRDVDNKTHEFPHGLTPPMRFARHRRFRPRTRRNDIEEVEREVQALFDRDASAADSTFEWFDPDAPSRDASHAFTDEGNEHQYGDENADAEGEIDDSFVDGSAVYDQNGPSVVGEGEEVDIEALMADAFAEDEEGVGTPATESATPMIDVEASTPTAAEENENESEDDSGDEDDDDDDDEQEEMDDEMRQKQALIAETREDIAEYEKQLEKYQEDHRASKNTIIRKRLEDKIEKTREELDLKKARLEELEPQGGKS